MPKVSVIIPVYNVERFLEQCVSSILDQTMEDIEVILVDDGSTDRSGEICDMYAEKDKRVRVIHKANAGMACARNDGIDMASSPYLMFVDSDDWVEPGYCDIPYGIAAKENADLVLFMHSNILMDGTRHPLLLKADIKPGEISEAGAIDFNVNHTHGVWVSLYHKKLFETNRFPEGKYFEDVGMIHRLMHQADKIWFVDANLYNRRVGRPGSITTEADTKDHPDLMEMYKLRNEDLISWGYKDHACKCAFSMLVHFDRKRPEMQYFVDTINGMKGRPPAIFPKNLKKMYYVYKLSPALFDWMCIRTGKRA